MNATSPGAAPTRTALPPFATTVLQAHQPTVLVTSTGCDSDKIQRADLNLSLDVSCASIWLARSPALARRWVPQAVAGTRCSMWCLGPGPICLASSVGSPSTRAHLSPRGGGPKWGSQRRSPCRMAPMPASAGSTLTSRRTAASIRRSSQRDRRYFPSWVSIQACERRLTRLGWSSARCQPSEHVWMTIS